MKTHILFLGFISLILLSVYAEALQSVKGKIVNTRNEPLYNATVVLLNSRDSVMVKATIADKEGGYNFENIAQGTYFISVSMAGHDTAWTTHFSLRLNESFTAPFIVLKEGLM